MNEIEKMLNTYNWEQKRIARGAHNKVSHAGCKLPSDYMTTTEKRKLNGEVVTYDLTKPMILADFKRLPAVSQKLYLTELIDRYKARDNMLADMFGCNVNTVHRVRNTLGVPSMGRGGTISAYVKRRWEEFLHPVEEAPVVEELKPAEAEDAPVPETEPKPAVTGDDASWAALLAMTKALSERYGVTVKVEIGI